VPPPQASADFYRLLQRLQVVTVVAGRRAWSRMGVEFDPSWAAISPSLAAVTSAAQLAAATAATNYVPAVLDEQGTPVAADARVRPQAFAGVASDGRSLTTLLEGAVRLAKRGAGNGLDGGDALALGQRWLDMALQTIVTDAARDATAAEIITRPQVEWVRMANPPCCSRCAVLAGAVYKWNHGFQRHPRCDCVHIPTTVANADSYLTKPHELVSRGLITDLTKAQQQRIDDGEGLVKVLNDSRDRWREQMAADRKAAKDSWGGSTPPTTTVHDLMAHLTSRVEAINAMKTAGIAA